MNGTLVSVNVAADGALHPVFAPAPGGDRSVRVRAPALLPAGLAAEVVNPRGWGQALYAYPQEHYAFWRTVRAQAGVAGWNDTLDAGALGEDLTLRGAVEDRVWVGDVLRFADCELAVSAPGRPQPSFNARMGFTQASRLMWDSRWSGYWLAVRRPGTLRSGEDFELVPGPREVTVTELFRSLAQRHRD
jgi:MOSC domain-containing protein YiiM